MTHPLTRSRPALLPQLWCCRVLGGAMRRGTGPCSINEPVCLMKRTQSVWLGGDSTTNSCCHHRWGITPLHQLPSLIHHTHTESCTDGFTHTYASNCRKHAQPQDGCKEMPCVCVRVCASVCVSAHLADSLTHIHTSICTHTDRRLPPILLSVCHPHKPLPSFLV